MYGLRTLIIACFIHNFAWSYFFEFSPIYLIQDLHFTASSMGLFYGIIGGLYALGTGVLIRPFLSRFKSETLFWSGNILTGLILLVIPLTGQQGLWALLFPLCFFISFVSPTSTALISNHATSAIQGEALGLLSSVNAAALILSPLCASSFVGKHPIWVFWIGGSFMILSGLIYTARIYIKK
jgi:DHA1 family tetracycline resistance protein-like MFS transporter